MNTKKVVSEQKFDYNAILSINLGGLIVNWHNEPLGTIRYEELLNALLAIWKTRYSLARRLHNSELYEMYELGFEESLDAVAQLAGLEKLFEEGKSSHKARFDANEIAKPKLIEGQTTFIDITP